MVVGICAGKAEGWGWSELVRAVQIRVARRGAELNIRQVAAQLHLSYSNGVLGEAARSLSEDIHLLWPTFWQGGIQLLKVGARLLQRQPYFSV